MEDEQSNVRSKAKHEKNVLPAVELVELNKLLDVVAFPVEDFLLLFKLKGGSRKLSLSYPRRSSRVAGV